MEQLKLKWFQQYHRLCDPQLTLEMAEYMSQIGIEGLKGIPNSTAIASEDFAIIAEKYRQLICF